MRIAFVPLIWMVVACGGVTGSDKDEVGMNDTADCPAGEVPESRLNDLARAASQSSGIAIGVADRTCVRPGVDCEPLEPEQGKLAEAFLQSLDDELGRYPQGFLASYGPLRIWLVNDLKSESVNWEAGGLAFPSQRVVYINVTAHCTDPVRAHTIHHELYHVIDANLFVNGAWRQAWYDLNPAGFSYKDDYNLVSGYETHPSDGFVSSYAQTNENEDRAENFAYGVVPTHSAYLRRWIEDDDVLAKKTAALKYWLGDRWPELDGLLSAFPL